MVKLAYICIFKSSFTPTEIFLERKMIQESTRPDCTWQESAFNNHCTCMYTSGVRLCNVLTIYTSSHQPRLLPLSRSWVPRRLPTSDLAMTVYLYDILSCWSCVLWFRTALLPLPYSSWMIVYMHKYGHSSLRVSVFLYHYRLTLCARRFACLGIFKHNWQPFPFSVWSLCVAYLGLWFDTFAICVNTCFICELFVPIQICKFILRNCHRILLLEKCDHLFSRWN